MTVRDIDHGADALTRRLGQLAGGAHVTVGVHGDTGAEAHPSGLAVVDVATFVEFGTDDEPPRSFVRAAVDTEQRSLERGLARAAEASARGRGDLEGELESLGGELAERMRRRVPSATGTTAGAIEARVEVGS